MKKLLCILFILSISAACAAPPSPELNLGTLVISKIVVGESRDGSFRFLITGPYGYNHNVFIHTTNGSGSVTITDLEPGSYQISEYITDVNYIIPPPARAELDFNKTTNVTIVNEYTGEEKDIQVFSILDNYMTALGLDLSYNQAGDCFD